MRLFERHFTVQQANESLPFLREQFARVHAVLPRLASERTRIEHVFEVAPHNGGGSETSSYMHLMSQVQEHISEVFQKGILIKDLERGLVDFPHLRGDREVFLCWELNEPDEVRYWHEIQSGYAGRRALNEEDE